MGVCEDRKPPRLALIEALSNGRASLRYGNSKIQSTKPISLKQLELVCSGQGCDPALLQQALNSPAAPSTELALAWTEWNQNQSSPQELSLEALAGTLHTDPSVTHMAALWLALKSDQDLWRFKQGRITGRTCDELRQLRHSRRTQRLDVQRRLEILKCVAERQPLGRLLEDEHGQQLLKTLQQLVAADSPELVSMSAELSKALERGGYDGTLNSLRSLLVDLELLLPGQPALLLGSPWDNIEQPARSEPRPDSERKDLTALACFSIDSAQTQEVDDAIGLERRSDGAWIWVHIADPHQWIDPDCSLDQQALRRGSTLYLSSGPMPMFPIELARECMSLKPMQRSAALSVAIRLDADGSIAAVEPCRSWVRVSYGLTYEDADELIELAPPEDPDLADLASLLGLRRRWREQQGALMMEQAEGRLFRDEHGQLDLEITEPGLARSCVSESMLLAGAAMAQWSADQGLAMPFRTQAGSNQASPVDLENFAEGPVRWAQQRRGLSRSRLQARPDVHTSLGLTMYLQWTSPIRRYSDLLAHRQWLCFSGHLSGEPLNADSMDRLLQQLDQGQREAVLIARQDQRLALLEWLEAPERSWPQPALLLSWLREDQALALVRLEEWAMELPVQVEGRLEPGDELLVRLDAIDLARDQLRLRGSRE